MCTTAPFKLFSFHCPFQTALRLFLNVALNRCLLEAVCIITTHSCKDIAVWKPVAPLWGSCTIRLTVKTDHLMPPAAGRNTAKQHVSFGCIWKWELSEKPDLLTSSHNQLKCIDVISSYEWTSVYPQGHGKLKRPRREMASERHTWIFLSILAFPYWLLLRCGGWRGLGTDTQNENNFFFFQWKPGPVAGARNFVIKLIGTRILPFSFRYEPDMSACLSSSLGYFVNMDKPLKH